MGKTYVNAVKYIIHVDFEVKGVVDKSDIIGAIFGQSEGLLGDDLDLRELQKNGRLGRIEIKPRTGGGKTRGVILVPSSMDMVETSILGASIETVDKVGPCEAIFKIKEIEDTRSAKRQEITQRAQALLKNMMETQIPDTQELAEQVREQVRVADICKFGREKIDAGPAIADSDSIIVVEGRADVLNLLRNGIKNVIAMGGSKIPQTIVDLSRKKSVTMFVDGDRGGDLNVRKLKQIGKVDYVAQAPDGKEVEELTRKEIVGALRHKLPADEVGTRTSLRRGKAMPKREVPAAGEQPSLRAAVAAVVPSMPVSEATQEMESMGKPIGMEPRSFNRSFSSDRGFRPGGRGLGRGPSKGLGRGPSKSLGRGPSKGLGRGRGPSRRPSRDAGRGPSRGLRESSDFRQRDRFDSVRAAPQPVMEVVSPEDKTKFQPIMDSLKGSLQAKLLDEKMKEIETVPVRKMLESLKAEKKIHALIFDGIITKRVLDEAKNAKIAVVVGAKKGNISEDKEIKAIVLS